MGRRNGDMAGRGEVDGDMAVSGVDEERKAPAAVDSSSISDGENGWVQCSGWSV